MKKMIIAIDYHPVSEKIAKTGCDLAKKLGTEIRLVHVIGDMNYYDFNYPTFLGFDGFGAGLDFRVETQLEEMAKDFLEKAAKHLDSAVETVLLHGDPASCIIDYAEEWQADLIVMGTHSHSVLTKLLMGSQASKVLENTTIPVYVIPMKK